MKKMVVLSLVASVASGLLSAADVSVGFREVGGIGVEGGQSETYSGTLKISPEGTFYKTGEGALTVPSSAIENAAPYSIDVLSGKLTLSGAAGTPSTAAPAVTQKAAVWLDASTLTEGASVSTWSDVRGGADRYEAVAKWLAPVSGADQVPPVVAVTNGMKGVYFGGQSGKWMAFQKAGTAAAIDKILHVFVVHGVYATYGTLLGDTVTSRGYGLLTSTSANTQSAVTVDYDDMLNVTYLVKDRGDLDYYNQQGRFFLDGRLFDPRTTIVKRGRSLFEVDLQAQPQRFDAIYRNYFETYSADGTKRPGGDYMCEILLFTNHLVEAERLDVERYLLNKWNLPQTEVRPGDKKPFVVANPPRGTGLVKVAEGASAEVTVAANETTAPFQFDGEGDVVKRGAGTLLIGGGADRPFSGSFTLEEGDILVHGGVMPPVMVGSGETWNSANWPATRVGTVAGDAASGVRISRAVSASGNSSKTGSGELRVGGIASGTGRLTVEGGVLHLVGKERDAVKPDTGIGVDEVEIPNHSFELPFAWSDNYGRCFKWNDLNDWKNDGRAEDNAVQFVTASCANWSTWSAKGCLPPDGTNALMIIKNGYGYTTVTIPRAGTYEVSYYATSRYGSHLSWKNAEFGRRSQVDVMFADRAVGSVQVNSGAFTRFRHRFTVTEAEAGVAKKFGFKSLQSYTDNCMVIDDVHIRAVGETARTDVVKVPGGDFEESRYINANGTAGALSVSAFCRCMTSPDWTLSIASGAPSNPTNGYVAICTAGTPTLYGGSIVGDLFTPFYPQADGRTGSGVLGFIGNLGTATTATAFMLPKGKWLLRGEIGANRLYCRPASGSETDFSNASPAVEVRLTRGNMSVVSLGTVSATKHLMERCAWPTVVEVTADEGEKIVLAISQTEARGACMVDNLEFVPVTAGEPGRNLFPNGTFESSVGLSTFAADAKGVTYNLQRTGLFNYSCDSWAFGLDVVDGNYSYRLHNDLGLQEDVVFPAPGLYRLTVPAHTRSSGGVYTHMELRASVVLNDGSEMEIFNQPIPITQSFQEISYLFRMPEAGTHPVRINGIPIPSGTLKDGKDTADRNTMIDGIRLVKVEEGAGALEVPDVAEDTRLTVNNGAKLALDYDGKVTVSGLCLGGARVSGTVSAKTHPAYLTGMGEIEVKPSGLVLIVR